jgi:acetyl/propionyl-CoA carboxylase alpha subunit
MNAGLRKKMTTAAIAAARAVEYVNAGTIEFLVESESREFYFLEMNTRLQVEHPVTEFITGLDMVEWQLRIAAGEQISFEQKDLAQKGHAMECRIYAEDPAADFLPQTGKIQKLLLPEDESVRVDSGVMEGQAIGVHYDPLLAKIIVHADNRKETIQKMQKALSKTAFLGLTTNLDFLIDILKQDDFLKGKADTAFIERELSDWTAEAMPIEVFLAAALAEMNLNVDEDQGEEDDGLDKYSPWMKGDSFRMGVGK